MIPALQSAIDASIKELDLPNRPSGLFEPIRYILDLGGKRVRPLLVLLGAKIVNGDTDKAMPAAMAVEIFHNFSLIHDDIMDNAPLRRGQATVHERWDVNTAILSGDAMLVRAYQEISKLDPVVVPQVLTLFNETAMGVCQGQQFDMDFEQQSEVSISDYLEMIGLKTAVLLSGALQMGAMTAFASEDQLKGLDAFGYHIGRAFQLQDDYLDAFGDPNKVGKQIGGDIIAGKMTFLVLTCLQEANATDKAELHAVIGNDSLPEQQKVDRVKTLFLKYKVDQLSRDAMDHEYTLAMKGLEQVRGDKAIEGMLKVLAERLMNRQS